MPDWVAGRIVTALCFVPLLGYILLFLLSKEVSLRPWTTIGLMALGVGVRLLLILAGFALDGITLVLSILLGIIILVQILTRTFPFFVHASEQEVRAEIAEACRRLFIQMEEARPGEIQLTAKGSTVTLYLMPPWQSCSTLTLPASPPPGKLTLFFDWLRKRYPGPLPRIRIDLNRR